MAAVDLITTQGQTTTNLITSTTKPTTTTTRPSSTPTKTTTPFTTTTTTTTSAISTTRKSSAKTSRPAIITTRKPTPCEAFYCGRFGKCVIENGLAKCNCSEGYMASGYSCFDIPECEQNPNLCPKEFEYCKELPGSYSCECLPGRFGSNCDVEGKFIRPLKSKITHVWTDAYNDNSSEEFKTLAKQYENVTMEILSGGSDSKLSANNANIKVIRFKCPDCRKEVTRRRRKRATGKANIEVEAQAITEEKVNATVLTKYIKEGTVELIEKLRNVSEVNSTEKNTFASLLFEFTENSTEVVKSTDSKAACYNSFCNKQTSSCTIDDSEIICRCNGGYVKGHDRTSCDDENECETNATVCNNKPADCENTYGSYRCRCPEGHHWDQSAMKCRDPCENIGCRNGGKCQPYGQKYVCSCPYGYTGMHCEEEDIDAKEKKTIIIGVSTSLGSLCILVILLFGCYNWRQRRQRLQRKKKPESVVSDAESLDTDDNYDKNWVYLDTKQFDKLKNIPRPRLQPTHPIDDHIQRTYGHRTRQIPDESISETAAALREPNLRPRTQIHNPRPRTEILQVFNPRLAAPMFNPRLSVQMMGTESSAYTRYFNNSAFEEDNFSMF